MHLDATVGGAVCAGSHGSSLHHGTLSDSVTDVRLATADGRARWLLAEGGGGGGGEGAVASDLLAAVRVSLGALGVVTAVELALSPLCAVRRASERLPFRTADDVSVLVARARASEHAWVHWRLGEGEAQLTVLERAAKPQQLAGLQLAESLPSASLPAQSRPSGSQHLAGSRHAGSQCAAYDGLNWFATPAVLPDDGVGADEAPTSAQPAAAPAAGSTEPLGGTAEVPAPSMEPAAAVWVSSEYALPLHSMADAVDALAAALGESHRGRLVECKFAGKPASASLLGCNGGGEVCCFNVWWRATWTSVDERAGATLRPFEEVMQRLGATPHWGKHHALPARYVERVFGGRAERFQAVARQLDPGGMFAPDWSHDVNIVNN
ncbi:hypothetical protein T492DRAFT_1081510 [Pavlovales sp. CCMP2436]|nr:hypothetical protein T492DRAFT_1081510 [Pavlovales sp. CCMP2436]